MGNKHQSRKNRIVPAILCIIILAAVCTAAALYYVNTLGNPYDESMTETVTVDIPTGSGTEAIGEILQSNGLISSSQKFKLLSRLEGNDGKYKAGSYLLSPSMSSQQMMEIIISGDSNTCRFTIQEGLTAEQTADKLAADNLINKDAFMAEIQNGSFDYRFMTLIPSDKENILEGFLYPETYEIFTTASEHDIIDKMLSQFDKLVTDEYYDRAAELGYDMYQIVTIASLIERETLFTDERPVVASVIYNRLAINMPLQIDATVQYALPEHKSRLNNNDLKVNSPYNTYEHTGLPPGPICSPSISSIEAALYPESTNYYYYVLSAQNNGSHKFSNTYEEFLKNKREYINSL